MKISGHVDLCGPELIEGWLYCDAWEGEPIKLQVFVGSQLVGECSVDRFRADLQEVGYGDGRCGFSFFLPETLASSDFSETRLRLVDTPVFLLPDEFSNVSKPLHPHELRSKDIDAVESKLGTGVKMPKRSFSEAR